MRYPANCSILFTELPLLERAAAARAAGFEAVEFWWPFADPVPASTDVDAFTRSIRDASPISFATPISPLRWSRGRLVPGASRFPAALTQVSVGAAGRRMGAWPEGMDRLLPPRISVSNSRKKVGE